MNEKSGTAMLVVNSVCGCAAGMARPGVRLALQGERRPTASPRCSPGRTSRPPPAPAAYIADIPPSSPSIAFFKDGELVYFIPRHRIEGRDANAVAGDLAQVFAEHCAVPARRSETMGTFHQDKGELHGITVSSTPTGPEIVRRPVRRRGRPRHLPP